MLLYKRKNLVLFFVILILINLIISKDSNKTFDNDMKPPDKTDDFKPDDFREKEIILKVENDNLQIKLEIYNIYLYFLTTLNIIFIALIFAYFIYKICVNSKIEKKMIINLLSNKNNESNIIKKNSNNNSLNETLMEENENSRDLQEEDLMNNSGLEAPPIINELKYK